MIVETTLAIITTISLTILLRRLKSFCDDNNISYEVMVRLNRSLSNRRFLAYKIYIMTTPIIKPINIKEYTVKQSKYQVVGKLPIKGYCLRASGSGKSVLLQNTILDIYRG